MRSSRAMFVLAACAASVLVVGCGPGGDSQASSDLGLSDVTESESSDQPAAEGIDDSALRIVGDERPSSRAGANEPSDTGRPTPPTLSAAGAAAMATSTTVAPLQTTASTVPPTSQATTSPTASVTTVASSSSTATTVAPGPTQPATTIAVPGEALDAGEGHSLGLLNELRTGLSLTPLAEDAEMAAFARDWSRQMASSGNFEHSTGPYGENIAFTSNTALTSAEAANLFHELWLDSPGHYGNMTNDSYVKTGVGLFLTERGWYATHVFSY